MGNEDVLSESGGGVMLSTSARVLIGANFGISGRVGDYYFRCYIKRMGFYYINCRQSYNILRIKSEPRRRR